MPDLEHTLQGHDLGFLKILASAWGMDLNAADSVTALPVIVKGILEHAEFDEVIESLPADARGVLQALLQSEGRMAWAAFTRKYGDVRRMGAARRDRERPDRRPASAVEVLWYRGLVGRAFFDLPPAEPQEYAYIPEDVLPLLPTLRAETPPPLGRPATPHETAHPIPANDRILDDACTLLAALRLRMDAAALQAPPLGSTPYPILKDLLRGARLLDAEGLPDPEQTRAFLEAPRGAALAQLVQAWMEDAQFNELRLLPGLRFEGEWQNNALHARKTILELVSQIPQLRWWSLPAFVAAIQENAPDFQRPAGDYDSWFIRQAEDGPYLRGFGAWDLVDGALVRFFITGPMHWLGLLDLAAPEPGAAPSALRLSEWAEALWHGSPPEKSGENTGGLAEEKAPLKISSDGQLSLPALTPRAVRYQVARFCQWEGEQERAGRREYTYRITPAALERARAQGLRVTQLLSLLRRHSDAPLPAALIQALEHWESSGTQAVVEHASLLRVTTPDVLTALRKTRAARCLGEALNETTILVRPGTEAQVIAALAEIGYLAEAKLA